MSENRAHSTPSERRNPIEVLAEQFAQQLWCGEAASISEYIARYPEHADEIRRLFPAILSLERRQETPTTTRGAILRVPPQNCLPQRLGDFRLIREIARGGMGVVYEAEQVSLKRRVALKVLAAPYDPSGHYIERFHREAAAAARLHHTNIVPVFGTGECEGVPHYAMQFIAGESLAQVLAHGKSRFAVGPLSCGAASSRFAARCGIQAAEALAYAHDQGILHRDVKPSNLIVDAQATIWLTDFGLAKAADEDDLTAPGGYVGTLRYLCPDRIRGNFDTRSDLFGLGLTLFELLAGRPAFDATERSALLQQVLECAPPKLRNLNPSVPRDLETVIMKAIDRDPARRYQTGYELADDLRRFLSEVPVRARPIGPAERLWRWARRKPILAGVTAALIAAIVGTACITMNAYLWIKDAHAATTKQLARAEAAERSLAQTVVAVTQANRNTTESLFEARLNQARSGRLAHRAGQRHDGMAGLAEAAAIARELEISDDRLIELRSEAIACLALPDVRQLHVWDGYPSGSDGAPHFTPDMKHYTQLSRQRELSIRAVSGDTEVARLTSGYSMHFSPNGEYLADLTYSPLRVWDWRAQRVLLELPYGETGLAAAFDAHSKRFAVATEPGVLAIHELPEGRMATSVKLHVYGDLAFDPSRDQLAVGFKDGIEILDLKTEAAISRFREPGVGSALSYSPDGSLLASAAGPDVYIWDMASMKLRHRLTGHQSSVQSVIFSSDGNLLFTSSYDETGRVWDAWSGRELLVTHCSAEHITWAERGLFRHGGNRVETWEFSPAHGYRSLPIHLSSNDGTFGEGAFSPDERWIAIPVPGGVAVCGTENRNQSCILDSGSTTMVLFHPLGEWLLTSGRRGVLQWPIADDGSHVRIGLPRQLLTSAPCDFMSLDDAAQTLAVVVQSPRQTVQVVELASVPRVRATIDHTNVHNVSLSPDGELLATGTWNGYGIKVWNSRTGELVQELLPDARVSRVHFSGDGQHLITAASGEVVMWDVATWHRVREFNSPGRAFIPGSIDSTPGGSILLLQSSPTDLVIFDQRRGRPLALLSSPYSEPYWGARLSPMGEQILVTTKFPPEARVWNMRLIRAELQKLGLDWDSELQRIDDVAAVPELTFEVEQAESGPRR